MDTVKYTIEERVSKEGNKYKVLVLHLTDDYEKLVFLDKAEFALLEISNKNKTSFNK